ncbi:MAG: membrane protein insertion efficiency factor YidD [Tildeniella nuda ZEHNDER 1965/U140]|jgi:putative component of membrane protein insertase Oxa1/YidC/SpoIIIJ protein YidD|nr:membrane protein insertion efficiency factor YidD [Tildeniella nuda ZEHNDER 1965/U140]
MPATTVESFAKHAAIASLNAYQKHLSPRKGFSCPHRLLYGNESCSDYTKQVLINQDLRAALKLVPSRFQACKVAAQTLQRQQASSGCIVIPCCIPL